MQPSTERINRSIDSRLAVVIPFPIPRSDFGLVAALRVSHPDAVHVLCERYSGEMLAIASRILGPDPQVRQVVIDTIRRALARIDESFESREFPCWLLAQLLDEIRHRLRARRWRRLQLSSRHSWAEGVGCSERVHATYGIIDRMDDAARFAFCLVAIHSLDVREAAKLLGLAPENVEQLLERAYAFFVGHIPRAQRNLARRKVYYLSLAAEIVQEQDLVIEGWWIGEYDIASQPTRPRSSTGWLVRRLAVLVLLACAAFLLIAQANLVWTRQTSPGSFAKMLPMRTQTSQGSFGPFRPGAINGPTASWRQSQDNSRAR